MAPGLNRWIAAGVAACALIAVGNLPPRGHEVFRGWRPQREEVPSAAQRRLQELGVAWGAVDQRLRVAGYRREAEPALAARRASGQPGPELLLNRADSVIQYSRAAIEASVDTAWMKLELGTPKVSMLLVIPSHGSSQLASAQHVAIGPASSSGSVYLLPDSTDRTTCVALIRGADFWIKQASRRGRLTGWMGGVFGPCAFYARFGAPSARVRHWLDRGKYDVIGNSAWVDFPVRLDTLDTMNAIWNRYFWNYDDLRFGAVACLAGRPQACRDAIRMGDEGPAEGPLSRIAAPGVRWRPRDSRIVGYETLLAQVVRQVGAERFQEFWTTSLPIDSALTIALQEPVGDWVARWQGTVAPRPRLGAAPRWVDALLSLVLVGIVLTGVMLLGQRRQVR